ncbi:MAG: hypothetical protein NZ473_06440 [Candidatus Kapabacteria bacterium]|nr:hypothetical protein [Candidatus Kapabacteria bacterium]MCS7169585.1 hypothetical protein [Candidatus Kapabacteria bacterium]MDW7996518.1 hypothetical protein [Bacteroidota bacterium]
MKTVVIRIAFVAAFLCLLLGGIGRLLNTHFWLTNPTWHELAQTFLLFAVAWGIYQLHSAHRAES